ncbi:MAG: hypothetical protein ACFCVH_21855 [Alphaproteobacteria bacterium]
MPQIEITPNEYLDTFVKPLVQRLGGAATGAYTVFVGALNAAFDLDKKIGFTIPNPFPPPPDSGGSGEPPNLLPPLPSLQPIDPEEVLKGVARAVRDAEKLLNTQNLAIGGATAEVTLVVQVGGIAGANATLKISIGPTPRP